MRKISVLTLLLAMSMMTVWADPVTPAVARQAAQQFLTAQGSQLKSEAFRAPSRNMGSVTASPYYVFNASADKGFVVVSGDDCVGDNLVMGYTTQGRFDADKVPANMQWWLDEMSQQITRLSKLGVKAKAPALHADVAPLVTTKWNQGENTYDPTNPYNYYCPETDGRMCVTGCMATALAQVLNYHRWPEGITSTLPGYTMENGRKIEALPPTTFDWDNMVDDYTQETTEAQQLAVAKLMRYCGQTVQMDYTPDISNGMFYDVDMLVKDFGLDQGLTYAMGNDYTPTTWDAMLYKEISEKRPLAYSGSSTGGGHAFVIDGYQVQNGKGYYHVNWGWAGESDGYYLISNLEPSSSGTGASSTSDGYSRNQTVLIGLKKAEQPPTDEYGRYLASMGWDTEDEDDDTPHTHTVVNTSYKPGTWSVALVKRNADGTFDASTLYDQKDQEIAGIVNGEISTKHTGAYMFHMDESFIARLADGHYELTYIHKEKGTNAPWKLLFGISRYIEINKNGGEATITYHPAPKLDLHDFYIDGVQQRNLASNVIITILNKGTEDLIGAVSCHFYKVENGMLDHQISTSQTGIFIDGNNGHAEVSFPFSTSEIGKFALLLFSDGNDENDYSGVEYTMACELDNNIGCYEFEITELEFECQKMEYNKREVEGADTYFLDATLTNGTPKDYEASVLANLYISDGQGDYVPYEIPGQPYIFTKFPLEAGQTGVASIKLKSPLEAGEYKWELLIANDFVSKNLAPYFVFAEGFLTVATGIDNIYVDENDQSLPLRGDSEGTLYNLAGQRVNKNYKGIIIQNGKRFVNK